MEHNKAPSPDDFPADFYETFWETIKDDLLELFRQLHARQLEFFVLILVRLFCYLKLMKQKGSNNTDQSVFLTLVSKIS
jgi:hypothetical protein